MIEQLVFFGARIICIAHKINLRTFDRPVNQRVHTADGAQDTVKFAAGHPEANQINLLKLDSALLEPAFSLFRIKAFLFPKI